jgi:RNA polymerase sigma-70 factor (ECF subfamily)
VRKSNLAWKYDHQKEISEEIVSDVFVTIWMQRKNLSHVHSPETYIFIAVKNRALNYTKRFSTINVVNIEDHSPQLVDTFNAQKELEQNELFFKMDQAVRSLPQQCQLVFRLVKEDGMKYKEVAEVLDISYKTVQTQMLRAMKKLAVIMGNELNGKNNSNLKNIITILWFLTFCSICR